MMDKIISQLTSMWSLHNYKSALGRTHEILSQQREIESIIAQTFSFLPFQGWWWVSKWWSKNREKWKKRQVLKMDMCGINQVDTENLTLLYGGRCGKVYSLCISVYVLEFLYFLLPFFASFQIAREFSYPSFSFTIHFLFSFVFLFFFLMNFFFSLSKVVLRYARRNREREVRS